MADNYPKSFTDKYEIIECLSSTQQGETLLAHGREDDRYYIAKLTRGETDSEADMLEKLSHPALPQYVERISGDGALISVREYINGTPLHEYMHSRPLSDRQAVDIGVQLCDVLTYLHTRRPPVIHRDVKPQNVIINDKGRAVLIDFGIARTYKQNAKKDTVFYGTNQFAPPEQYGFAQTDARADIFSLGMLLKFLLTGGDTDAVISDRYLRSVVERCTAFAPEKRYRSAVKVKEALKLYSDRRPVRAAVILAVALALAAGFALGRLLPTAEEFERQRLARIEMQSPQEYARAREYGFVPSGHMWEDPDKTAVTWEEYCGMLGVMIERCDPALLPQWEGMTADAPDTEMKRDGGMVALLFAGELMGADEFNSQPPPGFGEYAPRVWQAVTMDYPVFDWNSYKKIDEGCFDDNYVGPAFDYSLRRVSTVTGKPLLELDGSGDLRLEQPFTLREAALSVIRLYESSEGR